MWYKVSRTSLCDSSKPCNGAVLKMFPEYEGRAFKSFEEHDSRLGEIHGKWLSKGTEHKVTAYGISRRLEDVEKWAIEINTLEQLQEFVNKYGDVVLTQDAIEIYDYYRE